MNLPIAPSPDRRRHHRQHERILDRAKLRVQRLDQRRPAQPGFRRSSNGCSPKKTIPAFGATLNPLMLNPETRPHPDPGLAEADFRHPANHGFGPVQRRPVGQLREGDQVLLVLGRDETRRDLPEAPAGQHQQHAVNPQREDALPQHARDPSGVSVAGPRKNPVERAEKPTQRLLHQPREPILGCLMILEQHRAQRRRQGQELNAEITVEIAMVIANCR